MGGELTLLIASASSKVPALELTKTIAGGLQQHTKSHKVTVLWKRREERKKELLT